VRFIWEVLIKGKFGGSEGFVNRFENFGEINNTLSLKSHICKVSVFWFFK
jgi:hypothetical protein